MRPCRVPALTNLQDLNSASGTRRRSLHRALMAPAFSPGEAFMRRGWPKAC